MFRKIVPFEVVADETSRHLLSPMQKLIPEAVQAAIQALDGGGSVDQAGQAFLAGLQIWAEKIKAEHETRVQSIRAELSEARNSKYEKEKEMKQLLGQIKNIEEELETVKKERVKLERIITSQNQILAQQHDQIMRFLSTAQDDTHS
jgi:septal ring factor EnvC (AmiA/AmiB activator)